MSEKRAREDNFPQESQKLAHHEEILPDGHEEMPGQHLAEGLGHQDLNKIGNYELIDPVIYIQTMHNEAII